MQIEIRGLAKLTDAAKKTKEAPALIKSMLLKEVQRFSNKSVASIKENYLSGPRPEKLGVVTGRLRSSIRYLIDDSQKQTTIRFGSDVIYAATHEFGDQSRGIRDRAFLKPGVEGEIPEFMERIEEMLAQVASRGFGGQQPA